MSYFQHPNASNSDLKSLVAREEGRQKPDNIQLIYDFGTEFHAGILEPHKADLSKINPEQVQLIKDMSKTFWKDPMCRDIAMASDFRREHEFYRSERFGIGAKCKADGESKKLQVCLELKGLAVTSEKQFLESLLYMDYDQASAWYLPVMTGHVTYRYQFIVGISKKQPDKMFKLLVDREHQYFKSGTQKVKKAVYLWKAYGFK